MILPGQDHWHSRRRPTWAHDGHRCAPPWLSRRWPRSGRPGPLAQVADTFYAADYDDVEAAKKWPQQSDIVTIEFENIPASTLQALADGSVVAPGAHVLATTRHRIREKSFLRDNGFPVTEFGHATNLNRTHSPPVQTSACP